MPEQHNTSLDTDKNSIIASLLQSLADLAPVEWPDFHNLFGTPSSHGFNGHVINKWRGRAKSKTLADIISLIDKRDRLNDDLSAIIPFNHSKPEYGITLLEIMAGAARMDVVQYLIEKKAVSVNTEPAGSVLYNTLEPLGAYTECKLTSEADRLKSYDLADYLLQQGLKGLNKSLSFLVRHIKPKTASERLRYKKLIVNLVNQGADISENDMSASDADKGRVRSLRCTLDNLTLLRICKTAYNRDHGDQILSPLLIFALHRFLGYDLRRVNQIKDQVRQSKHSVLPSTDTPKDSPKEACNDDQPPAELR